MPLEVKKLVVGDISTNCYLLSSLNETAVIDPGGEADLIIREIKETGCDFKYVINTHYHSDHVLADNEIKKELGGKILIHEAEKSFIDFKADVFLKEGDAIKIGEVELKVINTPGHTKGSICLLGEGIIFTGDTLFKDGYGRTDLRGGSQEEIEKSLDRISGLLKPGIHVYPGHGEDFIA